MIDEQEKECVFVYDVSTISSASHIVSEILKSFLFSHEILQYSQICILKEYLLLHYYTPNNISKKVLTPLRYIMALEKHLS